MRIPVDGRKKVMRCACAIVAGWLAWATSVPADTVFSAGFEYASEPTIGTDSANLNSGMTGLIGTFSGALPAGSGSGDGGTELVTFDDGPAGTRVLLVDRGEADGSLVANLSSSILVDGAAVSFDVATRRTASDRQKDYEIIGFDSADRESFHIRVIANTSLARLATVSGGGTETYDLITTWGGTGTDANNDLPYTNSDPTLDTEMAAISLVLGSGGYTIGFSRGSLAYTTDIVAYNGTATSISRIEIQFQGGTGDGVRTGFFLDNLNVTGTVPEPSTLILLSLGLGLRAVSRRRRG